MQTIPLVVGQTIKIYDYDSDETTSLQVGTDANGNLHLQVYHADFHEVQVLDASCNQVMIINEL